MNGHFSSGDEDEPSSPQTPPRRHYSAGEESEGEEPLSPRSRRRKQRRKSSALKAAASRARKKSVEAVGAAKDRTKVRLSDAKEKAKVAKDKAKERLGGAKDKAKERLGGAKDKAKERARGVRDGSVRRVRAGKQKAGKVLAAGRNKAKAAGARVRRSVTRKKRRGSRKGDKRSRSSFRWRRRQREKLDGKQAAHAQELDDKWERRTLLTSLNGRVAGGYLDTVMERKTYEYMTTGIFPETPQRFVDAEKGNQAKADARFRETLQFRVDYGMYKILKEPNAENFRVIKENYPHFYHKRSKSGSPVYYEQLGKIDVKAIQAGGVTIEQMLYHYMFLGEFLWTNICPNEEGKSITVLDCEGAGIRMLTKDALSFIKGANGMYGRHYPEKADHIYVINVPMMFSAGWRLVKPFIDPNTLQKGKKEVTAALLEQIPAENLPEHYGGKCKVELGQSPEERMLWDFVARLDEISKEWDEEEYFSAKETEREARQSPRNRKRYNSIPNFGAAPPESGDDDEGYRSSRTRGGGGGGGAAGVGGLAPSYPWSDRESEGESDGEGRVRKYSAPPPRVPGGGRGSTPIQEEPPSPRDFDDA